MSRERHCLRQRLQAIHGTDNTMCRGQSKQYHLCQKQLCPASSISFKQYQCSAFNAKAFGKIYHHWVPLYPDDYTSISSKPCDLQCTSTSRERQLLVPAHDGTSCRDRTHQGVCISGKCEPVGCDGKLYSARSLDRCGVCGGNGSTCYRVSGNFRKCVLGYTLITTIPAGAFDILITEKRNTENILGNLCCNYLLKALLFTYYNFNGKIPHITYEYTVPHAPEPPQPIVSSPREIVYNGPISERSEIQKEPVGTELGPSDTWSWLNPQEVKDQQSGRENRAENQTADFPPSTDPPLELLQSDLWRVCDQQNDFTLCQTLFGGSPGSLTLPEAALEKKELRDSVIIPAAYEQLGFSPVTQSLKAKSLISDIATGQDISRADMYRWKVSAYSPCSSTCNSGISSTYALCIRYDGREVDESHCDPTTRPEPTQEFCSGRECMPRWESSGWSECSRSCGQGVQVRSVRCWKMLAPGLDSSVYDEQCDGAQLPRPPQRKVCKNKPCGPQWELSEWSECVAPCGSEGVIRREVRCSSDFHQCDESIKPPADKSCISPSCDHHWAASEWGPCSGPCSEGHMSRYVTCRDKEGKAISDAHCDTNSKPIAIQPCGELQCAPHWVPQEWAQCNATCGRGEKTRSVLCAGLENGEYREYNEYKCDLSQKPEQRTTCFQRPCSAWFTTTWSQCSKTCGSGQQVREVKCYQGEEVGHGCDPTTKPESKQACQLQPCPTESPDENCEDKATANCSLVLKVKLCSHWYYRRACCRACGGKSP
ncbi:hypothetical protein GDO86_007755 [Hymenochirus boettgeri]|uniref:PLAC domain-containing protein n=1 Tax=Hymenochirus boettgeri TaxID=247094 RepID=A0A8T2J2A0_9PIPI|nr:hypothetical protein GDO86_007755 [Hymenochirus boettgeri]